MGDGGDEGRGRVLAPERVNTESGRTMRYKVTTRAERATSVQVLEKGSDLVV